MRTAAARCFGLAFFCARLVGDDLEGAIRELKAERDGVTYVPA
jgi:hypothetical protein